jgi:RecA-family ATPase
VIETMPMNETLPVMKAADLSEDVTSQSWLVESLWAFSAVGILGGAPKCCKSWLGLDMAVSVASHTACLGAFAVSEGSGGALVYMAEDQLSIVKSRLQGICRHRGLELKNLNLHVITAPSLRLDLNRDQERLKEAVSKLRPRLLLLDPFVRLHRIDENNSGDVSALLGYLRGLQRSFDVAIIVTHHARKNASSSHQAGQGLRGSGDLHAWGDSNLYLRRTRESLILTVEHRASKAPDPFAITLVADQDENVHLEICESQSEPQNADSLESAVLKALEQEPMLKTHLRSRLKVRNERLGQILTKLCAQGAVVRHGDKWAVNKNG